ncbi:hypothetical protein KC19_9G016200 [Ceratodon purpureus]|uniref:Enhancer of polycomb-like protein n=1 Tax=Ceratodon purpureus TaxID=3225 RepID=A0A8T0GT58_CERPU|nr:hypothetical protein KC19_9G016200 [Ceratodon purpureus]
MEAKAVTSGMTAMSRRSREHRASKNAGTIRETRFVSQLDIASTSKNPKVGILSPSDALEHGKDWVESPNLRRSSRFSEKPSAVYASKRLEARANGAKVHVQGVKNMSVAVLSGKSPAVVVGVSEAWGPEESVEAGGGVISVGGEALVANSNGASALTGSGGTPDGAGQANGRPLRGRPRGRHTTPAKKGGKRAKRLQEVSLTESDGARILGRRIKVFWRDEDRWFYGLVKAYNRGRRTHKIVYDDKEEEWVKLHEEKFKLQVLEGEVFGVASGVVVRHSADETGIESRINSLDGKESTMGKQEFLGDEMISTSAKREVEAPVMTSNVHVPLSPVRVSESGLESAGFCYDGESREESPKTRKGGSNVRGVEESEDASPMVSESADLEDPYAIDHTSISDSLVMFMRSKQSVMESRKAAATSIVVAASESAAAGAKPTIEVSLSVEAPLCRETRDSVEISDVAVASLEATGVVPDLVPSVGCTFEARDAGEEKSCGDGEGSGNPESPGHGDGGGLDPRFECGRQNVAEVLESSDVGGLHTSGHGNSEHGAGEAVDLSDADRMVVDAVMGIREEAECVGLESGEDAVWNAADDVGESGDRVVESSVGREVGPHSEESHLIGSAPTQGLASVGEPEPGRSIGESGHSTTHVESLWLLRTGRFISWSIGTNLVNIDCAIGGQDVAFWILGVDNVWRCVPYLTLFVDVILEGDRSKGSGSSACPRRCHGEQSEKGISLRRSVLSAVFSRSRGSPGLTCPSSALGSARIVLHGSRTPSGGLNPETFLRQGIDSAAVEGANEGCFRPPCASSGMLANEQCCNQKVVEQACDPTRVEQARSDVADLPVLEVLECEDGKVERLGDVVVDCASDPGYSQADACESFLAAPSPMSAEDDVVRETDVAVVAGSGAGLTEVQIGSAVEGEDEGGLACYRSWKSVKRGFSQITPEELGSNGLGSGGMLQGLLDSELGCMAVTKRQKVHVESLSSRECEDVKEVEKEASVQEIEMREEPNTRSVDTGNCESAVPRVNVLKLRKCSTGKGGWRVAGNSGMADRSVMQSGGGEPLTPSSIPDRKRAFRECLESNPAGSVEENGHGASLREGPRANGHEGSNGNGPDEVKVKVKGMWSNCEVSSIQDAPYNPRKRFKQGSVSSGSSDDSYVPECRADEAYPSLKSGGKVYLNSVCQGCLANVLVVQHDRGWRERGATVELRSCNGQGWMLVISVRGENMYAYKAEQAMATGSTNRHNHAIVWKGGKGWSLEFEDKKQWQVFKEVHEECYRRNGKMSSVRHIPIPGVRHIEEVAPRSPGCQFARPYSRYIRRAEDEVEVALGKSRVVYDMDSEDEQWLAQINTERANARGTRTRPLIAEETLERVMDKLEKDAYLYQQQERGMELDPNDVGAESCTGLATQEVIKVIYGYWVEKRTRKGMPLVRHFQPPAWELYQKRVKAWEREIAALQVQQPFASVQQLAEEVRKPPLFAFCLRPRGLEVQPKLSKQKSHKKQPWSGSAPRAWVGLGSLDGSLDRRQYYTEPGNGPLSGPRRPGRPRLTEVAGANLSGTFNAVVRTPPVPAGGIPATEYRSSSLNDYAHRRAGMGKKVGRKARRQRLLAAAQESRRKRLLMRDVSSIESQEASDLALAAARARSVADAARARAQALYAVADAAMHKAVAAVIAADALHAAELAGNAEAAEAPAAGEKPAVGPAFGSWRRGVAGSTLGGSGTKGSGSRHGVESDGEDALLPVASWSQELGAGLGTRLLNKDAEMEGVMVTRSVHVDGPGVDVGLVRARG